MPYQSDLQRRFMHARHPAIARRWDAEEKGKTAVRKSAFGGNAAVGRRMAEDNISKASPKDLFRAAMAGEDLNIATNAALRAGKLPRSERLAHAYGRHSNAILGTSLATSGAGAIGHQVRERRKKAPVAKRARVYDAHDERQRKLGAMAGAAGITGLGATAYGGAGAVRRSRDVRAVAEELRLMPGQAGGKGGGSLPRAATRAKADKILAGHTIHLSPKHLGALGGGLGLLGVSGELARRGRSDSNRRWK